MLIPFDDYPVHQTPQPLAHPLSGDRNTYDRFFFNGYDRDGQVMFGAALGLYPNRQVIDGAFSVVREGVQRSVYASGRLPADRTRTEIGPLKVEVVEPMRRLRVLVEAGELGITAQLEFRARSVAVQEPHFLMHSGSSVVFDYTRLTQFGTWLGSFTVDGETIEVDPARFLGCRDRSWGVRPVGEPPGGAPAHTLPQFFWLWAPLNFDDHLVHVDVNEEADGRRWHQTAVTLPTLTDPATADPCDQGVVEPMRSLDWSIDWQPGTRRARAAALTLESWSGAVRRIELTPVLTFQMRGLGYLNPEWGHGTWKGELVTGAESWVVADLDPLDVTNLHVQQLVRATDGEQVGVGVLEQLVINEHRPSGLLGFLDGAPG
ncbi:hypothetical protein [Rhabdothermincola sp.]|uniref:hypothetical protein n=1 Tax=Rhabdothermincola sp. TaxID=2820405 RepID=UPI002FDF6235